MFKTQSNMQMCIQNLIRLSTISKSSILDVWLGSEHASACRALEIKISNYRKALKFFGITIS